MGPTLFLMFVNDLPEILQNSHCLLFADDAKLYKIINNIDDCLALQQDLFAISKWCETWKIDINISKCAFINFSLLHSRSIDFSYSIGNAVICKVTEIKDLGVTFCSNLNFNVHICNIVSKSYRMFGFMRRILKPISDPAVYLSLYHTLIRSRLEYCSFIWSPYSQCMINKIEQVQKKFLKTVSFKCGINNANLPYESRCKYFNLQPLNRRRQILDLRILNKVLNNSIDCPFLLSCVNFRVPVRFTRNKSPFVCNGRLLVRKNSPLIRSMKCANDERIDATCSSTFTFRRILNSHFST